jgi:hypothetical protein
MKHLPFSLCLLFILAACNPLDAFRSTLVAWNFNDLRLLEPPGDSLPGSDLIAAYVRLNGNDIQIRMDLLDLEPDFYFNVYLLLDTLPAPGPDRFPASPTALSNVISGQNWDWLLSFPLAGIPQAFPAGSLQPDSSLIPRIQRDPVLDTITISLNQASIPDMNKLVFQIFFTSLDGQELLDLSPPVSFADSPRITAAPLLLVFKDTFPALTPAQALRRWDGAHTGPTGERHGLKHILLNSGVYNIPVVLLDLKTAPSLSALDFIGAMPQIQNLASRDLLILPDVASSNPDERSLSINRSIGEVFDLPGSDFVYARDSRIQSGYQFQFIDLPDRSHLIHQAGTVWIPLPDSSKDTSDMVTKAGFSLDALRLLLSAALSPDPADLVILGGSLPVSNWGDSDIAGELMAYITAHPWIQPLNADGLKALGSNPITGMMADEVPTSPSFPLYTSQGQQTSPGSTRQQQQILQDLKNAPGNSITNSAWQMFFSLTAPAIQPQATGLQYQYLNQVESLLAASRWAENPGEISDCSRDIDLDTMKECILSNNQYFAVIETDGGRLSFLFGHDGRQAHQLVGPSSQFAAGLSDPSLWRLPLTPASDPHEIPGAFSDKDDAFMVYTISDLQKDQLVLLRLDGQIQKTYGLTGDQLTLDCWSAQNLTLSIPLVIDPQDRFQPGWSFRYHSTTTTDSYQWGLADDISIIISSTTPLVAWDFTGSRSLSSAPENPDQEYPPGHFLPFPLALVQTTGIGGFSIELSMIE